MTRARAQRMEQWLSGSEWIAQTREVSIADLAAAEELFQLDALGWEADGGKYGNVARWLARMRAVPHYEEVHETWKMVCGKIKAKARL